MGNSVMGCKWGKTQNIKLYNIIIIKNMIINITNTDNYKQKINKMELKVKK